MFLKIRNPNFGNTLFQADQKLLENWFAALLLHIQAQGSNSIIINNKQYNRNIIFSHRFAIVSTEMILLPK